MNKETASPLDDYKTCLQALSPLADYVAVNISSPNTAGLRDLQAREALESLLSGLMPFKTCPILLKVAPDLSQAQCADVAALAMAYKMDGLIVSNTTIARPAQLATTLQQEKGGLSGRLLCDISTQKISEFYHLTEGRLPIIGVGGIASAEDAYAKIRAGASLVELYTGLVYQGPALIARILEGLVALLEKDGFSSISGAVGTSQNRLKAVG
jgi:dihydroorotate dehydrogenase